MERITHKFMMELPAGMFDELKVLSHQNHQSVESYIKQFVRLRSFIDKTIVMRHSLDLSVEVAVDGKPILSPELSILRFVGQSGIRNSVAFSDREFAFLKTKSNMSLYVRESIAFGLEMLEKSGEKSGARFSVGDGNFIFLAWFLQKYGEEFDGFVLEWIAMVAILLILFLFWLLGYGPFQVLHIILLRFNGFAVTIWDVLIFLVLIWLVGSLPSPFRQIAVIFILIWVLSLLGIIAVAGLSSILVIAIIVGVLLYILSGGER